MQVLKEKCDLIKDILRPYWRYGFLSDQDWVYACTQLDNIRRKYEMNWLKYLGIISAFSGIGIKVFSWLKTSQTVTSDEGEEISLSEISELDTIITDAINEGLRAADVPLVANVELTYIG